MPLFSYDLHLHSCLSPCGDDDSHPADLAGLACLLGLQIVALTDHNSCKNTGAFVRAAEQACARQGHRMLALAGMELTTSEEAHLVCLFPDVERAMIFDGLVEKRLPAHPNRPEIFGRQILRSAEDEELGDYENLLIPATGFSLAEAAKTVRELGGVSYPAHIDRMSYSVLSNLGFFPDDCGFTAYELADMSRRPDLEAANPVLKGLLALTSSDAHRLEDMGSRNGRIELPELTEKALFERILRGA